MSEVISGAPEIRAGRVGSRHVPTLRQMLFGLAGAAGIAAAATYGVQYWQVGRFEVSTDDAYVQADSIIIAPRVAGYIAGVLVTDNQPVKAGQVLAKIDDRDLRTALDQAAADRVAAEQKVANIRAQLDLQQSVIAGATAQLEPPKLPRHTPRRIRSATASSPTPAPAASSRRSRASPFCYNAPPTCNAPRPH